ncbi:hypothetical protein AAT19DRAFT_8750 [Rhodotorula toruloides]|uniref:Proteophosphoglycan ppg4 n=1 Tax=Rhodotorula toruloides TaxID=5286 RepID=A0A2T0AI65_RHOTO|nr:hypothetical protein AAT19DRAFT_8750 [Rhodotorula toruloides]
MLRCACLVFLACLFPTILASPTLSPRATNISVSSAFSSLTALGSQAATAVSSSDSKCTGACQSEDNLQNQARFNWTWDAACNGTATTDEGTLGCACTVLGSLRACSECLKGNATSLAKDVAGYCRDHGLGGDALSAYFSAASTSSVAWLSHVGGVIGAVALVGV